MPIYQYVCQRCSSVDDEFRQVGKRDEIRPCLNASCLGYRHRDIVASMRPHTELGYQVPILSDALGIHPDQIPEAKKRFPHHEFHPDGRMILSSHSERNKVMKELGYHDRA